MDKAGGQAGWALFGAGHPLRTTPSSDMALNLNVPHLMDGYGRLGRVGLRRSADRPQVVEGWQSALFPPPPGPVILSTVTLRRCSSQAKGGALNHP